MSLREVCHSQLTSLLRRWPTLIQPPKAADLQAAQPAFLFGAGLFLWSMCLWAHFGGNVEGRLAVLIAIFLGIAGVRLFQGAAKLLVAITVAIWTIAQGIFVDFAASTMSAVPYSFIETTFGQSLFVVLAAIVGLVPGIAFGYALCRSEKNSGSSVGVAVGAIVAWLSSLLCPLAWLTGLLAMGYLVFAVRGREQTIEITNRSATRARSHEVVGHLTLAVACGVTLGIAIRFVGQWFLWTPSTWACVIACGATASLFRVRWSAAALVGFASGGLLLGYPLMIRAGLFSTAQFDSVAGQTLLNFLLALMTLLVPFIAVWSVARRRPLWSTSLALGVGTAVGMLGLFPIPAMLVVSAFVSAAFTMVFATTRGRLATVALGCAAALLGTILGSYQPQSLASVLHAPTARMMAQQGQGLSEISAADDARLIESLDVAEGVLTAWSQRGFQVAINEDDRSLGTLTKRTDLGPSLGAETMSVVLPVALHAAPRRLAICGAGNGESVLAATEFGIPAIEVVDTKARLDFLERHSGERAEKWDDERVSLKEIPARWLSHCEPLAADVLVVNLPDAGRLQGAGTQTVGHVRDLNRHLSAGGILCQRIDVNDLGATTVLHAAAAYRQVFPQVHTFEIGVGQWVVIGTHQTTPMINIGFVERLRRSDVRRALGHVGWDWSVVLKLYTLGPDELTEAIAKAEISAPTIASSEALRTQAVTAMSRDAAKYNSFKELLTPHVTRSLDRLDDAALIREVEARIADATERDRLLGESTDDFWSYRAVLRDRLKTRPRAAIQQVSYSPSEKPQLHPEDERRKEYLAALGVAISSQNAAVLDRFLEPYDPLVSPFVHAEAAKIHGESEEAEAALSDLVASVFKTYNDMSVRNAVQALAYICDGQGGDNATRYDLAQGLLEQMRRRWHARLGSGKKELVRSEILRESIDQARETFAVLDALAAEDPSLAAHWSTRKPILRRDLVERMRMHQRAEQEKRLQFEQKKAFLKAERERKLREAEAEESPQGPMQKAEL